MDAFMAIAEPVRRKLLDHLRTTAEATVTELQTTVGMSQPATSKHLTVLRQTGLVSVRQDGARRLYALNPVPLVGVDGWLKAYREMWEGHMDRLAVMLGDDNAGQEEAEKRGGPGID